jgi:hypothetical protein
VLMLSQRKGAVKARDIQRSFANSNRPDTATVRQWFVQLSEMGRGVLSGEGAGLTFDANADQAPEPEPQSEPLPEILPEPQPEPEVVASPEPQPESTPTTAKTGSKKPWQWSPESTPAKSNKLEKGTHVVICDRESRWNGRKGAIELIDGTNGKTQYRVDGSDFVAWFGTRQLEACEAG